MGLFLAHMTINDRISALRSEILTHNIDAVIIPSGDPHQSEYMAEHWQSRAWSSGFTGSAGTVIVTPNHAGLWTDSRYFIQAVQELEASDFILHRLLVPHTTQHLDWLVEKIEPKSVVAVDGYMFSHQQLVKMKEKFAAYNIELRTDLDLIAIAWKDRPALPQTAVLELTTEQVGQSRASKIQAIRAEMMKQNVNHLVVTTLDDLCWILNFRGKDVSNNPLTIAYLIVHQDRSSLFIDTEKLNAGIISKLDGESIQVFPYDSIQEHLTKIDKDEKVWVNPDTINGPLYDAIIAEKYEEELPSTLMKALKNETEIGFTRTAMQKDGIALVHLWHWLEQTIQDRPVTEVEVAEKLIACREAQGDYHGESFPAIVGYQGNGAIVHYHAMPDTCASIKPDGILLLDSGGQYLQGTTDITRTVALGPCTKEQQKHFTLVLKGHIALDSAVFPTGTPGRNIDVLARTPLWKAGLNYGHGTGHGVGFFLNVHEGPQGISSADSAKTRHELMPGMITSNEPGFYLEGKYGIRIENLVLCKKHEDPAFDGFLNFENLTLFPIDLNLIDMDLLNPSEIDWLTNYHQLVYDKLSPSLDSEKRNWLKKKCGIGN